MKPYLWFLIPLLLGLLLPSGLPLRFPDPPCVFSYQTSTTLAGYEGVLQFWTGCASPTVFHDDYYLRNGSQVVLTQFWEGTGDVAFQFIVLNQPFGFPKEVCTTVEGSASFFCFNPQPPPNPCAFETIVGWVGICPEVRSFPW